MREKRVIWFCVADAETAFIKEAAAPRATLHTRATLTHEPYEHGRYEPPGRTQESATATRHSFTDADGPVRREKRAFARVVADYLGEAALRGAFDRLVVAAPPKFLGDIRAALQPAARERVAGEVAKDLTKESDAALSARLSEIIHT